MITDDWLHWLETEADVARSLQQREAKPREVNGVHRRQMNTSCIVRYWHPATLACTAGRQHFHFVRYKSRTTLMLSILQHRACVTVGVILCYYTTPTFTGLWQPRDCRIKTNSTHAAYIRTWDYRWHWNLSSPSGINEFFNFSACPSAYSLKYFSR